MHRNEIENIASNYCSFYGLKEEKCLEELQQLVAKHYPKEYLIFAYICDNAYDSRVEMHGEHFIVIMDVEENEKLAKDLSEKFWIENVLMWRECERVGHGFRQSNLYKKIKVYRDMKGKRTFKL